VLTLVIVCIAVVSYKIVLFVEAPLRIDFDFSLYSHTFLTSFMSPHFQKQFFFFNIIEFFWNFFSFSSFKILGHIVSAFFGFPLPDY